MRLIVVLAILAALAIGGCVQPAAPNVQPAATAASSAALAKPVSVEWKGHVVDSRLDGFSHQRPSEDVLFAQQQEGFLFDIKELPQVFQVSLDWTDPNAKMMIMLHSHKEHGTNVYDEHDSKLDAVHPKCIQVPAENFSKGEWQIMVHTQNAQNLDYTLKVTLVGGAGAIVKDKMHGHNPQDGSFQVSEKKVLECQTL